MVDGDESKSEESPVRREAFIAGNPPSSQRKKPGNLRKKA